MQSLCTLHNRVAGGHATLATKRTLLLTWAGLPPAGSHQLCLAHSFNHLVSAGEQRRWHSNAKRLGGFHIDDQLETSWLLDRQIGGLGTFEDFVDVHGSLVKKVRIYRG